MDEHKTQEEMCLLQRKLNTLVLEKSTASSTPNTPKKAPNSGNLRRFSSNASLKTLPEINAIKEFDDEAPAKQQKVKKGLLERRGSNASLTIDLGGGGGSLKARSVSNLALPGKTCTIYESVVSSRTSSSSLHVPLRRCAHKSLSNENLYVPLLPPPGKLRRRIACWPSSTQTTPPLSEDFRLHLQSVQYLQTAGRVLDVEELKCLRVPQLHQEFWEVPLNLQEKCAVSGSQARNRYRGVLPNEHSRVVLTEEQPYIHANYIKGPDYTETAYIATQGPMAHTCEDFWEMAWRTKSTCIVMLTHLIEKGRGKCELYFPLGRRNNYTKPSSTSSSGKSPTYLTIRTTRIPDKFTFDLMPTGHGGGGGDKQKGGLHHKQQPNVEEEIVRFEARDEVTFGRYTIRIERGGDDDFQTTTPQEDGDGVTTSGKRDDWSLRRLVVTRRRRRCLDNVDGMDDDNHETTSCPNCTNSDLDNPAPPPPSPFSSQPQQQHHSTTTDNNVRRIAHFWFTNWQDHKVVEPRHVLDLACRVLDFIDTRPHSGPPIVHCSAGIGRTGCFLAVLNGIRQLRAQRTVDVLAILCSLRLHRGGMIQTAEQYELVHRVLGLYASTKLS